MSHVYDYDGQYFRLDIAEVTSSADPEKAVYVSWCSDAFKDLKDMPSQAFSRFIGGPPVPNYAEARRYAFDWIKANWDARTKRPDTVRKRAAVIYTVWIFKRDSSLGYEFEEFSEAQAFASAAEKSLESTKVVITNNESPQYLTVWEKET
jgi:hypothetical protein